MIIFDTETTGLLRPESADISQQPYLIEFYGAKLDDKTLEVKEEFETLVKPDIEISELIERITGISNEMVSDAPQFIDVYDSLFDFFFGEKVLVAHNAGFDVGVIHYELQRWNLQDKFAWPKYHQCTVELTMHIENRRLKLADLYAMATDGKTFSNAHRAKSDVMALITCYRWMKSEGIV